MWRKRRTSEGRSTPPAPSTPRSARPKATNGSAKSPKSPTTVIDLRESIGWAASIESDATRRAELAERFRERRERAEATADLKRLRARHWSGERIVEESRFDAEWWQHSEADPYAVLGLLPGTSIDDAAVARRRIAKECHPDASYASEAARYAAEQRMIATNAAYDRLRRALRV